MPRLCLGDDVWEIAQDGARLVIVAAGKQTVRKFISPDHAKVQLDKLVAEKLGAGWVPTAAPAVAEPAAGDSEPREPALEAAIVADPYDAHAYSVYGDWYQARQHPRGELIALQLAEEDADAQKLRAAAKKHLARYRGLFLGELSKFDAEAGSPFGWRFGFIHRLELDNDNSPLREIAELLDATIHHPSGRFLAEVSARLRDVALDVILEDVADVPTLRELSIVTSGDVEDTASLSRSSKLKKLVLKAHGQDGEPASLAGIARVAPTLESLMLRIVGTGDGWDGLAPLFGRTDLALRHLGMRSPELVDRALCAVADGPLAARLETLDIALTDPDEGVRALLAKRERFTALRVLKLSVDRVVPKVLAGLRASISKVIDVRRDPDDDYLIHDPDDADLYDEVQE